MNTSKKIIGLLFICLFMSNTSAKAQENLLLGQISMFAGNFAPRGWALCDGQLLPISQYSALFSILGTIYGGDGRTNFALPDLRGRAPIHEGQGPGLTYRTLGAKSGVENVTLITAQIPSHNHTGATTYGNILLSTDNAIREIPITVDVQAVANYPNGISTQKVKTFGPATGTNTVISKSINTTTENTGGNQSFSIMQPTTTINYIIALQGIYPSRP